MSEVIKLDDGMRVDVSLDELIVWADNPRTEKAIDERDAINKLFLEVGLKKMLELIEDIALRGLQANEIAVCVKDEDTGKYLVYDGNRRISALKTYFNPSLLDDEASRNAITNLKKSIFPFEEPKVTILSVAENVALELAFRKHGMKSSGLTIQKWSPWQRDNALERAGKQPLYHNAYKAIKSLGLKNARELQSIYKVEYTDLERILTSASSQKFLDSHSENLEFAYKAILFKLQLIKEKEKKPLSRIFHDNGPIDVFNETLQTELAEQGNNLQKFIPSNSIDYKGSVSIIKSSITSVRKIRRAKTIYTNDLISSVYAHTIINIDIYVNTVFEEMTRVKAKDLKKFPAAFSSLLRMFIDISVNSFCAKKGCTFSKKTKLAEKIYKAFTLLEKMDFDGMTNEKINQLKSFVTHQLIREIDDNGSKKYILGDYLNSLNEMVHQGSSTKNIQSFTPEYNSYVIPFIIAMSNNLKRNNIT